MFELFNVPALDEAIKKEKTIKFSHNPVGDRGALGKELRYLENNNYVYYDNTMTAELIK